MWGMLMTPRSGRGSPAKWEIRVLAAMGKMEIKFNGIQTSVPRT